VPLDVGRKMVEIAILQSGQRDGVHKLQGRSILGVRGSHEQKQNRQSNRSCDVHSRTPSARLTEPYWLMKANRRAGVVASIYFSRSRLLRK